MVSPGAAIDRPTTAWSGRGPAVQVTHNSCVSGGWSPPLTLTVRHKAMLIDTDIRDTPEVWAKIAQRSRDLDFSMASDLQTGSLLSTLAASKVAGRFLELGTGTGLSTA